MDYDATCVYADVAENFIRTLWDPCTTPYTHCSFFIVIRDSQESQAIGIKIGSLKRIRSRIEKANKREW